MPESGLPIPTRQAGPTTLVLCNHRVHCFEANDLRMLFRVAAQVSDRLTAR
jgi:hypothetical protein